MRASRGRYWFLSWTRTILRNSRFGPRSLRSLIPLCKVSTFRSSWLISSRRIWHKPLPTRTLRSHSWTSSRRIAISKFRIPRASFRRRAMLEIIALLPTRLRRPLRYGPRLIPRLSRPRLRPTIPHILPRLICTPPCLRSLLRTRRRPRHFEVLVSLRAG